MNLDINMVASVNLTTHVTHRQTIALDEMYTYLLCMILLVMM